MRDNVVTKFVGSTKHENIKLISKTRNAAADGTLGLIVKNNHINDTFGFTRHTSQPFANPKEQLLCNAAF
jgi:hypothetical protein